MSVALIAVALAGSGCGEDEPTAAPPVEPSTTSAAATGSIEGATGYLLEQLDQVDAASLMIIDYVGREFDVAALDAAHPRAVARLAEPALSDDEAALRRLVDPGAGPADVELTEPTTTVLTAALHCDREDFDAADMAGLDALVSAGGYGTTHAALAVGWLDELGCTPAGLDPARTETVDRIAEELAAADGVTDLAVEQSATLHYLGAGDRVPAGWADAVAASANDDAGWGPSGSNWHMTMLALWTLLAEDGRGTGAPMLRAAA